MRQFTKQACEWLWQRRGEIFLQAVLMPSMTFILAWIAKQFTEPGMIRDIGVIAICVAAIPAVCFLIVWLNRKQRTVATVGENDHDTTMLMEENRGLKKANEDLKLQLEQERKSKPPHHQYLLLLRIAHEGRKFLTAYDSIQPGDTHLALTATGDLQAWHRNTLVVLKEQYFEYWNHFADIGAFGCYGVDKARDQSATLLNRIEHVREVMSRQMGARPRRPMFETKMRSSR